MSKTEASKKDSSIRLLSIIKAAILNSQSSIGTWEFRSKSKPMHCHLVDKSFYHISTHSFVKKPRLPTIQSILQSYVRSKTSSLLNKGEKLEPDNTDIPLTYNINWYYITGISILTAAKKRSGNAWQFENVDTSEMLFVTCFIHHYSTVMWYCTVVDGICYLHAS